VVKMCACFDGWARFTDREAIQGEAGVKSRTRRAGGLACSTKWICRNITFDVRFAELHHRIRIPDLHDGLCLQIADRGFVIHVAAGISEAVVSHIKRTTPKPVARIPALGLELHV